MPTGGPSGIAVSHGSPPGALTVVVCTATGAATPVAPAPTTTAAPTPNQILRLVFMAWPARTAASAFVRDTYNLRPKASSNTAVLKNSNERRQTRPWSGDADRDRQCAFRRRDRHG